MTQRWPAAEDPHLPFEELPRNAGDDDATSLGSVSVCHFSASKNCPATQGMMTKRPKRNPESEI